MDRVTIEQRRPQSQRTIVVSNRLPVVIHDDPEGGFRVGPGSGGLITALGPAIKSHEGTWVGWLGHADAEGMEEALRACEGELGYRLRPVQLTEEEVRGFYEGFANEVLWPLFHDFIPHCNFDPQYWPIYERVNRKYAEITAAASTEADYVWIHDYHLMLVARELRKLGARRELGFFLHIPFPPLDVFVKMPWRQEMLEGLLHYDLIGFQTPRDLRNFLQCVRNLLPDVVIDKQAERVRMQIDGRVVWAEAFPISIDYQDFLHRSVEDPVSEMVASIRMKLPMRQLIVGLDRLDYTKGIPHRIEAFDLALQRYPELLGKVTLLQVVIPSRTRVAKYKSLKDEIERLVGEVSGRHAQAGWAPIQYIFRSLTQTELLAYYRACDVALVTPLKDGMNLVAKEYCACSLEDRGTLILSEFAGAAYQLADGALLVNPFDTEAMAEAIHQAVTMSDEERRARMAKLRRVIRENDIYKWVDSFLAAAADSRKAAQLRPVG